MVEGGGVAWAHWVLLTNAVLSCSRAVAFCLAAVLLVLALLILLASSAGVCIFFCPQVTAVSELVLEKARLASEGDALRADLHAARSEAQSLRSELHALHSDLDSSRAAAEGLQEEVGVLRGRVVGLEGQVASAEEAAEGVRAVLAEREDELEGLQGRAQVRLCFVDTVRFQLFCGDPVLQATLWSGVMCQYNCVGLNPMACRGSAMRIMIGSARLCPP